MRIRLICLPESTSDLILEVDRRWCEMECNKSIVTEYISAQTSIFLRVWSSPRKDRYEHVMLLPQSTSLTKIEVLVDYLVPSNGFNRIERRFHAQCPYKNWADLMIQIPKV